MASDWDKKTKRNRTETGIVSAYECVGFSVTASTDARWSESVCLKTFLICAWETWCQCRMNTVPSTLWLTLLFASTLHDLLPSAFASSTRWRNHCCVTVVDLLLLLTIDSRREDLMRTNPDFHLQSILHSVVKNKLWSVLRSHFSRAVREINMMWWCKGADGFDHYPNSLQIILLVTSLDLSVSYLNTVWEDFIIEPSAVMWTCETRLRGLPTLPRKINWSSHITSLSTFLPSHSPCFLWSLCDDSVHTGCIILHSHIDGSVSLSVTQRCAPESRWDPAHSYK